MGLFKLVVLAVIVSPLAGCSEMDDDYFPYRMTGLDSWLYDSATEQSYLAGFTAAS